VCGRQLHRIDLFGVELRLHDQCQGCAGQASRSS
jgi:hypothetical protein